MAVYSIRFIPRSNEYAFLSDVVVSTPFGIVHPVITTRSINELDLNVGLEVAALVKSTEVSLAKL